MQKSDCDASNDVADHDYFEDTHQVTMMITIFDDHDEHAFDTDADDDDNDNIWGEHGGEKGCSHLSPLQQT